jgi:hypothetical protein
METASEVLDETLIDLGKWNAKRFPDPRLAEQANYPCLDT